MSFQEKRSLVSLIGTVGIGVGYLALMWGRAQADGTMESAAYWARVILLLVPVYIVLKVVLHVLFVVINVVATREDEPRVTDEMDRLIELKSTRNFYHLFMIGFMLALALLAAGQPTYIMLLGVIAAILIAAVTQDISEFVYYRRGL